MAIQKCDVNPLVHNLTTYLISSMLVTFELGGVILPSTHLAFPMPSVISVTILLGLNVICKL